MRYRNRMSVYFCGGTARPMFMLRCESRASQLKHASEQKANNSGGFTKTIFLKNVNASITCHVAFFFRCCLGPLITQCEQPKTQTVAEPEHVAADSWIRRLCLCFLS